MRVHKEGYKSIGITALVLAVINILSFIFISPQYPITEILFSGLPLFYSFLLFPFFVFPIENLAVEKKKLYALLMVKW